MFTTAASTPVRRAGRRIRRGGLALVLLASLLTALVAVPANPARGAPYHATARQPAAQLGFDAPVAYPTGSNPTAATRGDFDGDGSTDLAVSNLFGADSLGSVTVMFGDGNGMLVPTQPVATYGNAGGIEAGDVDGDGAPDLIVPIGLESIQVLRNDSAGSFTAMPHIPTGARTHALVAFDLDGDGHLDVAAANRDDNTVSVLSGDGTGGFATSQVIAVGESPVAIALADVDGTPGLDIVTSDAFSETLTVIRGLEDGQFGPTTQVPMGFSSNAIEVGDLDADGHVDVVVGGTSESDQNDVAVFFGSDGGIQEDPHVIAVGGDISSIALNDLNADGRTDIVSASGSGEGTVGVALNNGARSFGPVRSFSVGGSTNFVTTADMDGDGRVDIVATDPTNDTAVVLRNAGPDNSSRSRLAGPARVDFGALPAGYQMPASTERRLMFTNGGPDPIEVGEVITDGGWFSVGDDTCSDRTLPPTRGCAVTVSYTAKGPDVFNSATLVVPSDAANGQLSVPLIGEGGGSSPSAFPEVANDASTFAIEAAGRFGNDEAGAVVLSRSDVFADSLGGSVLTSVGPLLFSGEQSLDTGTQTEIDRVLPPGGTVYLLGGTAAISSDVESSLTGGGYTVVRLAGQTRVETAVAVADEAVALFGPPDEVAIARADAPADNPTAAWADAVAAGGWAANTGAPILLTPTLSVHPALEAWLASRETTNLRILGGTSAVSSAVEASLQGPGRVVQRIAGVNRFATAVAIADAWADSGFHRLIAPGDSEDGWAYTLALAGESADYDEPILLTELDRLPPETCAAPGMIKSLMTPTARTSDAVRTALGEGC